MSIVILQKGKTMKIALIAITAMFMMAAPVTAEESWFPPFNKEKPVKIPTGYEVKGCKDYYIDKNGRVHNVCKKAFGERWWWFDALPHSG